MTTGESVFRQVLTGLLLLGLISGCGWHLRGTLTLPAGLEAVYVDSESSDARLLSRTMSELLMANDVSVVDSVAAAQLVMNLLAYREDRRVISVGSNTLVTEYELIAEASYSVENDQGIILLGPDNATVIRSYEFDQDNVLGKAEEERLIQEEMRRELAQQIIRRLRFMNLDGSSADPVDSDGS